MAIQKKSAAHEKKHVGKAELEFKVIARRNRLLGNWAAEQLGLDGNATEAYGKEVVAAGLEKHGDANVVRKILADFAEKGVVLSESELNAKITEFLDLVRKEVESQQS